MIPGENPEFGTLCGTNMYAIGTGKERYMIDACSMNQQKFLSNVKTFCEDFSCSFTKILITHAHYDHMDGAQEIVNLM